MQFYTSVIQHGNNILVRGYSDGREIKLKTGFSPSLYVPAKEPTKFKSLTGGFFEEMTFSSINEAKEFLETYKNIDEFPIYGMTQFQYQYIARKYPGEITFDLDQMKVYVIDIETSSEEGFPDVKTANEEILLISVVDKTSRKNIVFGSRPFNKNDDDLFEYRYFPNEVLMLDGFLKWWETNCPDILTGWYIDGFDIPYLIRRLEKIQGEDSVKRLSPWGLISSREVTTSYGNTSVFYDIKGVVVLDYIDLYKKYTYSSKESYTLDSIASYEVGATKLELPGSFKETYTNHWDLFVRYNARDTDLVLKIDDKLKFIELSCTIAYLAKCNIRDTFGPVKTWDIFIYNHLMAKNIVIPPVKIKTASSFEGAWVKEPQIGKFGWIMSFDFASLYPSIIRQWNMSPETLVGVAPGVNVKSFLDAENNENSFGQITSDVTLAANGAMFRKDVHGVIPEVIKQVIDGRKIAKKEMLRIKTEYEKSKDPALKNIIASLNGKQMAFKILANALYGALSNVAFRYYDLRIAEAITLTGQASDQHIEKSFNIFMNQLLDTTGVDYVIAGDTDSIYLNVDTFVKRAYAGRLNATTDNIVAFLDMVAEGRFQDVINDSVKAVYKIGNCYEPVMAMKREAIASSGIWTAKKRYALVVHNSEGVTYSPYDIKIMGLDLIKASTPKAIRDSLKEALTIIFTGTQEDLFEFVEQLKNKFNGLPPEAIAFPRSVNDINKWVDKEAVKKGCPIHVRGSILYNKHRPKDMPPIKDGDKIKFIYLKYPNSIRSDIIAFPSNGDLPQSMGLHKYIDYSTQWEKVFINPLKGLTDAIKWRPEKTSSLEDFFV